jgi:hypothetical protein
MCEELHLSLATLAQVSEELDRRKHEEFIFIYHCRDTDAWHINLNEKMDGLNVVEILQTFQSQMIDLIRQQQMETVSNNAAMLSERG